MLFGYVIAIIWLWCMYWPLNGVLLIFNVKSGYLVIFMRVYAYLMTKWMEIGHFSCKWL